MSIQLSEISYKETFEIDSDSILSLYGSHHWSSAEKPDLLYQALMHSHSLISAWDANKLVGLGNAISDGFLVVYYPHLLVLPDYQRRGIGREIVTRLTMRYRGFHQQMLVADRNAVGFYKTCGFERAGRTEPMWIYDGGDR